MSADLLAGISNLNLAFIAPAIAAALFVVFAALPRRLQSYGFSVGLILVVVFLYAAEGSGLRGWIFWLIGAGVFFLYMLSARAWSEDMRLAGAILGAMVGFATALDGSLFQETVSRAVLPLTLILAVLAAMFALAPTIAHWRFRCRVWLQAPERLLEPPPRGEYSGAIAVVLGVALLLIGTLISSRWNVAAAGVAALAVGGIAHRARWRIADVMSIGLGGAAWFFLARDWFVMSKWNFVIGVALAACFLLWLAQFWHQQLRNNVPWTTSGRLIQPARNIAVLLSFLLPAVVYGPFLLGRTFEIPGITWGSVIFGLSCVCLLLLFARDIRDHASAVAVWCAGLVASSLGLPIATILVRWFPTAPLPLGVASALLILVVSLPTVSRSDDARTVTNALAYCILPAFLVVTILSSSADSGSRLMFVLCGLLTLIAFGVRSTRMRPASVAVQTDFTRTAS